MINADSAVPFSASNTFKFPALSCCLSASELTCLIGPHRTQLRSYLLMLAGIAKPKQGNIEILGCSSVSASEQQWRDLRCKIGYISGTAPVLSVHHALMNVMLPVLYHQNLPFQKAAKKARSILVELDCQFEPTSDPAWLNSYQRLQLALARALMLEPAILILDVPFNNLGAKDRQKAAELLSRYIDNRTVCMIGGLQNPHFLELYADRIIFLSEQKSEIFSHWDTFRQSSNETIKHFLNLH